MVDPMEPTSVDPGLGSVCVIGAGVAGLITAHTLLRDGFKDVQVLTSDKAAGGVWRADRVYPGLQLNSLHGEFSLSCFPLPEQPTGTRLTGDDLKRYMKAFADKFLDGVIQFETQVVKIRRSPSGAGWRVDVKNLNIGTCETREYSRIVLCTGACNNPKIPDNLSLSAAKAVKFAGPIFHTKNFNSRLQEILSATKPLDSASNEEAGSIVIIGGGRSAQDIATYLTHQGRKVCMVFTTAYAVLARSTPMPDYVRKSRLVSIFSPHSELRTAPERFLHTTWVGSKIVEAFWAYSAERSYKALNIPPDSPLRHSGRGHSPFWYLAHDEDVPNPKRFHALVNTGKIDLVAPARVQKYSDDGRSVVLEDGRTLKADVVILATGYQSSWASLFDDDTREELGLNRHSPSPGESQYHWDYTTLTNPPPAGPEDLQRSHSFVRGMVPAKNILRRDFAINGAVVSLHNSMTNEVCAHWISAYFMGDKMHIPATVDEALEHGERSAAWMRQRWPEMLRCLNESSSTGGATWTWPQWTDDLLEDMGLPGWRSGGNWLTWPFNVVRVQEIATLKEERDTKRNAENIGKTT